MFALRRIGGLAARLATLVASCAAAAALGACGGGGAADEDEIRATVRDLQRAFLADDSDRMCGLLSGAARKHVRAMGHDLRPEESPPCYLDVYMFIEGLRKSPTWRSRVTRSIEDVEVDGDRATAAVRFEDGRGASLPLVREEGRWRVDALFGGIPAARQEDHY